MKYIKNGKVVLDGTIKECDLEEKLLRALEIIVDKRVDLFPISILSLGEYNSLMEYQQRKQDVLMISEYRTIKEITKWN